MSKILNRQNNIKIMMQQIGCLLEPKYNASRSYTMDSIIISLYNKDNRPTVYQAQVNACQYGNVNSVTIDTIINNKEQGHESLKITIPSKDVFNIASILNRLLSQSCDGSRENTLENFTPIGLLYMANEKGQVNL
jgi:hypothetical protein